jgi:predicted ArsR family transcriptional regulator
MANRKASDTDVIHAIERLTKQHGYPPSVLELAQDLGIVKSAVQYHLDRLCSVGIVTRERGKPRTLRVVL